MSYDPYEQLANAIVIQAVTDYRKVRNDLKIFPKDKDAMSTIREVMIFFRSDCFTVLTSIDAESLIKS